MKQLVTIIISFIVFNTYTSAQDILVYNNDTIKCKIITITDSVIKYKYWDKSKFIKEYNKTKDTDAFHKDFYVQKLNKEELKFKTSHYFTTYKGDTIYCNIIKKNDGFIVYTEQIKNNVIVKDIRISKVKKTKRLQKNTDRNLFEISIRAGYMQRNMNQYSDLPPAQQKLLKEVKNGFFIASSAHYCTELNFSIGILYNYSKSKGSGNIYFNHNLDNFPGQIGLRSHVDIAINYIALDGVLYFRTRNKKTKLNLSANIGPMFYNENVKMNDIDYDVITKGNTLGYGFGVNITRIISKGFGLMINVGYTFGEIDKITWTNKTNTQTEILTDDRIININQLNIGAGIVIQL